MNIIIEKSLNKLPITNFLLSFLIVFHHSVSGDLRYIGTYNPIAYGANVFFQKFMFNLSECAVPIFFFISAYLFYRNYDGSISQYKQKVWRRIFSLAVPYVIFGTIGYIKCLIEGGYSGSNYFLSWIKAICVSETMPLWFIRELMVFTLLAPIFFWLKNKVKVSVVISLIIIIMIAFGYIKYTWFIYWTPVYLIGVHMHNEYLTKFCQWLHSHSKIALLYVLLYTIICWFFPNGEVRPFFFNMFYILFRVITPFVYIPIMIRIAESQLPVRKSMNYSFFVFCMHYPVISLLHTVINKTIDISPLTEYLIIAVSTYYICVLIALILQRYFPQVWYIINGRRR